MKKFFYILTIILLFLVLISIFTPYPAAYTIRALFHSGDSIDSEKYQEINNQIDATFDIPYPSKHKNNQLDSFRPKNKTEKLPVIIWVHGGAYVGGDKSSIAQYAILMAAEGYHVIAMNYSRAPEGTYPPPLNQLAEVCQFIEAKAEEMKIDVDQIFLAGDSAGAQIVAQFTSVQVNDSYAAETGLPQVIHPDQINGILLFSGLYNIKKLNDLVNNEKIKSFVLNRVGWAYFNDRNWLQSKKAEETNLIPTITPDYPPAFVVDGNHYTFTKQGKAFVKALQENKVDVTSKFYEEGKVPHVFNFMMDTPEAQDTFKLVQAFLHSHTK